ncbi:hypothetical protein ABT390_18115 [Streptomyces aurantiacus]|nr:hypothetical protein [Streptomyces aurantiacus]
MACQRPSFMFVVGLELTVIVLVAVVGKFCGTYAGARSQGLPSQDAGRLAALSRAPVRVRGAGAA